MIFVDGVIYHSLQLGHIGSDAFSLCLVVTDLLEDNDPIIVDNIFDDAVD